MTEIKLHAHRVFRETPNVRFFDITVPNSNGIDLIEHSGASISPPDEGNRRCWYVHKHQTDNNRVISGRRIFELFNPSWANPHWYVMLDSKAGALEIPPGCFHRSYSGNGGSLLLNHAVRDSLYDETQEFFPCHCPLADTTAPRYFGCTPSEVESFILYGDLSNS